MRNQIDWVRATIASRLPTTLLLILALVCCAALAESPPDEPLPPCIEVDGQQEGACPQTNENLTGQGSGVLSANGTVAVSIVPTIPVCNEHIGYPPYPWSPSGCYAATHAPVIVGCGYIDLEDRSWRESSCSSALYQNTADATFPMFTVEPAPGKDRCGGRGNYQTYVYGGPANVPGATWAEFGPDTLDCALTFNGSRPDGLYGPTWVKLRVGVDRADNGDERRGYPEYAEFYVPIDGDLREETVDVSLLATSTLDIQGEIITATYTVTLTNEGDKDADDIRVNAAFPPSFALGQDTSVQSIAGFPNQLHIIDISSPDCAPVSNFVGGSLSCNGISLAAAGDALGNDVEFIDVVARVINAADLPDLIFEARVPNDIDVSNNKNSTAVNVPLGDASLAQTRQLMDVLEPYFSYTTDMRDTACNSFRADIYARFERIRLDHPEVFANLSYGPITSGDYYTEVLSRAGHVGLLVYPKGTNYHETGIIVHGTPSVSPLGAFADSYDTQVGLFAIGEQPLVTRLRGTSSHGYYYRTPAVQFPGMARPEKEGCGFEGLYADNADEFTRSGPECIQPAAASSCPLDPDAMVVITESPVDLRVTNAAGQRVETLDGRILLQELDGGIHSMAVPHADGTFGWTLVLPEDDYTVDLMGTGTGPYRLTVARFGADDEPIETVIDNTTQPGQVDTFDFIDSVFSSGFETPAPSK